jgi:hypothetical protein
MTSLNLRADIYDPKTLAAMDQAFAAVWRMLRTDNPLRDYARDSELRIAIGKKLLNLVAGGVTDPLRLRNLTVESLLLPPRGASVSVVVNAHTIVPFHTPAVAAVADRGSGPQHADAICPASWTAPYSYLIFKVARLAVGYVRDPGI